jgi:hypothetical protein
MQGKQVERVQGVRNEIISVSFYASKPSGFIPRVLIN